MPTYTPGLEWPRSDGSESLWPTAEEQKPSNTENWWEKLPLTAEKYTLYEKRIGQHLAEKKGIVAASYRMPLPEGYALFAHHKPQPGGVERVDVYLKGCSSIGKRPFRSTPEFLPHAEWLCDSTLPLDDHSKCGCIYNKQSSAAQTKKSSSSNLPSGSTPAKRPSATTPGKSAKKAKNGGGGGGSSDDEDDGISPAIVPERSIDMKSSRRFRKGELVWFRIDTVHPPETSSGLPSITHWPGLVANIVGKSVKVSDGDPNSAGASMSAAWSLAGGVAPDSLKSAKSTFTSEWEYHIRALGLFSTSTEIVRYSKQLLPWAMGNELLGGNEGWASLGREGTRVLREGVKSELREDKGKGVALPTDEVALDSRWRAKWAQRWPFKDMPKTWETHAFRLGIAIKIATTITNSWTQTDKIDLVVGADVNAEDLAAINDQRKTLFQGVWWGGERIWLDDMIRLKKHRAELPIEALGLPSEGAADRAVLLRIRMITIEVSPDATENVHAWRCLLYGDIFELANASEGSTPTMKIMTDDGIQLYTHKAPAGLVYRQLNEPGSEVTVDIMDVAGRMYPDLLDSSTQEWLTDRSLSSDRNADRHTPGDTSKALAGLKPGTFVGSKSDKWKEDLYTMVNEANKITEKDMTKFYGSLVNPGGIAPKAQPQNEIPVQATNTNGVPPAVPSVTAGGA